MNSRIKLGTKLTLPNDVKLDPKMIAETLDEDDKNELTREDAMEFVKLIEEQRNAEQVERNRKLRINNLMRKAGCRSLLTMEHRVRRLIKR